MHELKKYARTSATTVLTGTTSKTSDEINCEGLNAMAVHLDVSGTGTVSITLQNSYVSGGNFVNAYDNNGNLQTIATVTTSVAKLFICPEPYAKLVSTIAGTPTYTATVIPMSVG